MKTIELCEKHECELAKPEVPYVRAEYDDERIKAIGACRDCHPELFLPVRERWLRSEMSNRDGMKEWARHICQAMDENDMDDLRMVYPIRLARTINQLIEKGNIEAAEKIIESGIIELVNRDYQQGFGPIVIERKTIMSYGRVASVDPPKAAIYIGARLTDEEYARVVANWEK